jgi:hypothetical protein
MLFPMRPGGLEQRNHPDSVENEIEVTSAPDARLRTNWNAAGLTLAVLGKAARVAIPSVSCGLGGAAYGLRTSPQSCESMPETAMQLRTTLQHKFDDADSAHALDRLKQAALEIDKTAEVTASSSPPKAGCPAWTGQLTN